MHRTLRVAALTAASALLLAACATSTGPTDPASGPAATSPAPGALTVDPRERADLLAQFPTPTPATVATTSVPLAEVLGELGVEVVAVPETSGQPLPAALDAVPRIGTAMAPDVEGIVTLRPELVVSSEASRSTLEPALADTGIPPVFLPATSIGDLALVVDVLGEALDRREAADDLLEDLDAHASALADAAADGLKVLLLIGASDSFMVMSDESFLGSLVELSGATNIAVSDLGATEAYTAIDLEAIVAAAPDVVLVLRSHASGDDAQTALDAEFAEHPAWQSIPAATSDRIHVVDYAVFGYTSIAGLDEATTTLRDLLT